MSWVKSGGSRGCANGGAESLRGGCASVPDFNVGRARRSPPRDLGGSFPGQAASAI